MSYEFTRSARKHQVADEDMVHAITHQAARFPGRGEVAMVIGIDRAGRALEVGVVHGDGDRPLVIHAKRAARKYLDRLVRDMIENWERGER